MNINVKQNIDDLLGDSIGTVYNVDTRKITIYIEKEEDLNHLRVNDIIIFKGINADEKLIGIITKVSKKRIEDFEEDSIIENYISSENYCIASLVGTFYSKLGREKYNIFKRVVNTYPEINSSVYKANERALYIIMNALTTKSDNIEKLKIGKFASNRDVDAILDGNRFFQRHASIVGSTGSGKSYTIANILEKVKNLDHSNIIVFDLHGEYNELNYAKHIKINSEDGGIKIPLWFFNYEEIHSLFIESSEGTSANQRAVIVDYILRTKKEYIEKYMTEFGLDIVTADIPIPFSSLKLKDFLEQKNTEEIDTGEVYTTGARKGEIKTKQGSYYGKLTNLITRLQTKIDDKKYSFVFSDELTCDHKYLNKFAKQIIGNTEKKVKVIDLSEIPSDILPIIIGIVTRLIYEIQFWITPSSGNVRHPLVLVCDEAHIYMSNDIAKLKAVERKSLEIFEKIAKEGRKYGVGLLIVSQRPSELNTTIVSQCNNIISLKITNDRDKSAVASMLTDSLVGLVDILPNLDIGECIVVGDAIMLPSKIILDIPEQPPKSTTIDFWDKWTEECDIDSNIDSSIENLIRQYR